MLQNLLAVGILDKECRVSLVHSINWRAYAHQNSEFCGLTASWEDTRRGIYKSDSLEFKFVMDIRVWSCVVLDISRL